MMKTKKLGVIFAVLLLSLSMVGVAQALWSETLYVNGTVNTGNLDAVLSCGPQVHDTEPTEKDVSSITGSVDGYTLTVTIENAYPCIDYYLPINIFNSGSIPWIMSVNIDRETLPGLTTLAILPADYFTVGFNIPQIMEGTQLEPMDFASGFLHVHLDNDASENAQYTFTITIVVMQWNEYPQP